MADRNKGTYAILSHPWIYESFQNAVGSRRSRRTFIRDTVRLPPGGRLLDLGCGPGDALEFLDGIDYVGIDHNPGYVERARARAPEGSRVLCGDAADLTGFDLGGPFDVVMAIFFLHHIPDVAATALLEATKEVLKETGRFVAIEPVREAPGQSRIARWLVDHDRGAHVRSPEGYRSLVERTFPAVTITLRHDLLRIPYSHAIIEAAVTPSPSEEEQQ